MTDKHSPEHEPTNADLLARLQLTDQRTALMVDTVRLMNARLEPISQTLDVLVDHVTTLARLLDGLAENTSAGLATIIDTLAAHIRDHGQP